MRFRYLAFDVSPTPAHPDISTVDRPYIPIRVVGPRGTARLDGLLDTGADETVLPLFVAGRVGVEIDPEAQARFRGVGGHLVTVTYGRVELEVGSGFRAVRWPATVAFLDSGIPILGHEGFLQYYTASFNGHRGHVTLTPNDTLLARPPT